MGLDTSHNAYHGPYSSFTEWRKIIASKIGIDLYSMEGYKNGNTPFSSLPDNPINIILDHSDCDGEIYWQDCEAIANALEAILPDLWKDKSISHMHYLNITEKFIAGCRLAFSKQENIDFH